LGQLKSVDLEFELQHTETGQGINAINIHSTASADTLTAAPPESQSRVDLILDPYQRVQHHGPGLVQVQCVALHPWFRGRLIGIPSIDLEGLDFGIWASCWMLAGRCVDCSIRSRGEQRPDGRSGRSEEAGGGAKGRHIDLEVHKAAQCVPCVMLNIGELCIRCA
jgi:hypothetical protein